MNKIELLTLIREIVKDELKELLRSKNGRAAVREIIGKEVRIEVDKLLTEMEQGQDTREVVHESPEEIKLSRMVERGELPPKGVPKKKQEHPNIQFTKKSTFNDMLNQTLDSIRRGDAQLPPAEDGGQAQLLREQYMDMRGQPENTSVPRAEEHTGKSVVSMMPEKDVDGNPLMVNPNGLPDHVQGALTRDYRKLMKKVEAKRG